MSKEMDDWADSYNVPIDPVREDAARCCLETARMERGERGPLVHGSPLVAEFSDDAFGVAAQVSWLVARALRATGKRFKPELAWDTAARLLRAGWKRGDQLVAQEMAKA